MQETLQKNATDKNRRETKVSLQEMKVEVLSLLNKKLILSKKGKKTRFYLCIYPYTYPLMLTYTKIYPLALPMRSRGGDMDKKVRKEI